MPILPKTENSLLVRTSFADEKAWLDALSVVLTENEDGFSAYVEVIADNAWENADWERLRETALEAEDQAAVLFVVDHAALEPDYPILVVDLDEASRQPFRCVARELWGVANNLNLANMDWEDFAESADTDSVFRGFAGSLSLPMYGRRAAIHGYSWHGSSEVAGCVPRRGLLPGRAQVSPSTCRLRTSTDGS